MKSIEEYKVYKQTQNKIECLLMNKYTLSRMSPSVSNMFDQFGVNIPSGSLVTCQGLNIQSVDFVKHYASCLARAPYLPCVTPFDDFEPYNAGEPIKSECLYLVRVLSEHPVYSKSVTLMYGFEAKELMVENRYNIRLKMLAQLVLILGTNDHLSRLLKELFEGEKYSVMDMYARAFPTKLSASVARRQTKQSYQPCSRMRTTPRCSGTQASRNQV